MRGTDVGIDPAMSLLTILIILIVVVLLFGGSGYHYGWYSQYPYAGPGIGIVGIILVVLVLLVLFGRI